MPIARLQTEMITPFPAIASILSPKALINDVLPGFGIRAVTECLFYSGGFNHTYRIRTNNGNTYYLRAYRLQWRTLADIQYELDVLNHLKQKGFPAITPVSYHDGLPYCVVDAPEGRRILALFTEAPGVEVSYEHEPVINAQRYGEAVARMHKALDDFQSPYARFHLDLAHFIDQPLIHIQPFLSHRPDDWDFVQQFAQTLRQQILAMPAELLEQGFCHGDLQGYHAKLSPDGTLTFYDFDCGGFGYRTYDLAVFLWCCRLEDALEARWQPFLDSYRSNRAVHDRNIAAVPLFACARYLWHMGVHTQNSPDWGIGFLDDAYFDRHLADLRQAQEDYLLK
jgi:Ser/Thr protein kinase RdoA (MazF antagonist)